MGAKIIYGSTMSSKSIACTASVGEGDVHVSSDMNLQKRGGGNRGGEQPAKQTGTQGSG